MAQGSKGDTRGVFTRGEEPRSEIVNTFSHSPIFRATTAQPLVKSHASSRLPRIGAPPFRRPLRHSIVRFRAPTTPESRKRNDQTLCTGACCSPMVLHFARAIRSPRSASRFPGTHTFGMPRSDVAALLLRLRKSYTLPGDHFYTLFSFERKRATIYSRDYVEIMMFAIGENRFKPRYMRYIWYHKLD